MKIVFHAIWCARSKSATDALITEKLFDKNISLLVCQRHNNEKQTAMGSSK